MLYWLCLVLIPVYMIWTYNRLVDKREAVLNDYRQIDIQLDRRWKVLSALISSVNRYIDYEKTVLKDVVALRSQAEKAKDSGDITNRADAENMISRITSGLHVVLEAYPDLKSNTTVLQLMEEIVATENKLSYAKQAYNDGCERFNQFLRRFPTNLIAKLFGEQFSVFSYWQLSQHQAQEKEAFIASL